MTHFQTLCDRPDLKHDWSRVHDMTHVRGDRARKAGCTACFINCALLGACLPTYGVSMEVLLRYYAPCVSGLGGQAAEGLPRYLSCTTGTYL